MKKFIILITLLFSSNALAKEVPRTVIALYNGLLSDSTIHLLAQMPLNHLGMVVEYHDVKKELPNLKNRKDVVGVLSWFQEDKIFSEPIKYINWLEENINDQKKVVIIGEPGFFYSKGGKVTPIFYVNKLFRYLGLEYTQDWINMVYDMKFVKKDPKIVEFERKYSGFLSSYHAIRNISKSTNIHLSAIVNNDFFNKFSLITTNNNGGYVASKYAHYEYSHKDHHVKQWYINPFSFFKKAFAINDFPVPDTTTINGRRIFYSHIDGDGFNNISQVEKHRKDKPISAEVILSDIIKRYNQLPITVGFIAAEIDKDWVGSDKSQKIAKKIMSQSNVEVASHTYSHPFFWKFFKYYKSDKEKPFLRRYPHKHWGSKIALSDYLTFKGKLYNTYEVPRAYAVEKFSLQKEISGSIEKIKELAPKNKKVKIIQWSGDTNPYEEALEEVEKNNFLNINGGDSRFDQKFLSHSWVSPLSKPVGKYRQIYASNSNENTYTNEWRSNFFGFRHLTNTFKNTNFPRRIKPFNIYYHMYSAERDASLNALIHNIEYIHSKEFFPITTSEFIEIVNDFYKTKIVKIDENKWQIKNNKLLTFRFDKASLKSVNFEESKGVIGQKHFQGSLYIFLDINYKNPVIAVKDYKDFFTVPKSSKPYLISSNWDVYKVESSSDKISYYTKGWSKAEFSWYVPKKSEYIVKVDSKQVKTIKPNSKGIISFTLNIKPTSYVEILGGST